MTRIFETRVSRTDVAWPSSSFPDDGGVGVLVSPGDELVEDDAGHVEVGRGRGEAITAVVAVEGGSAQISGSAAGLIRADPI